MSDKDNNSSPSEPIKPKNNSPVNLPSKIICNGGKRFFNNPYSNFESIRLTQSILTGTFTGGIPASNTSITPTTTTSSIPSIATKS